jgi:signal peptidase II
MESGGERRLYWGAVLAILCLDIVTKQLAEQFLQRSVGRSVFGEWFQLRLVYNPGAAFGLHLGPYSRWIFLAIALAVVVLLYQYHRTAERGDWFRQLSLGLVTGGAVGNVLDRIRSSQGVVDFFDLGVGAWRWPTFNVADMAVSCGAVAFAISLWREDARQEARRAAEPGRPLPPDTPEISGAHSGE